MSRNAQSQDWVEVRFSTIDRVISLVAEPAGLTGGARRCKSEGQMKQEEHTVDARALREQLRADYVEVVEHLSQTLKRLETAVKSTQDRLINGSSEVTFGRVDDIIDLALRAQKEWSSAQTLWAAMRGTLWD